jgi:hypothetical protein
MGLLQAGESCLKEDLKSPFTDRVGESSWFPTLVHRQMRAIRAKYDESEQDNQIDWYCLKPVSLIYHS